MKTPSLQLFYLIKKMSAAEKRFLKIHFSSAKSHLTELFDFINSQDNYDEKIVKANFSDSLISKNLKVYKVQLTELILRSQVAYHAKRSVKSQIRILLEEVDVLLEQFLVPMAMGRLHKAINIATKYNETALLVVALQHKFELERYVSRQKVNAPFKGDGKALTEALKMLSLETALVQLVRLLDSSFVSGDKKAKSEVITGLENISHKNQVREGDHKAAYILAKLEALVTDNIHDRIRQQEQIIQKFQTNHYHFPNSKYSYIEMLSDLLDSYVLTTKKGKVAEIIADFGTLFEEEKYNAKFLYLPGYIEAKHNFHHGISIHQLSALGPISALDSRTELEVDNAFALGFYIFEILSKMTIGESETAKKLLSVLQSATKSNFHNENVLLDLIEMVDHYDCDNLRTVNYLLSSFQRKLKRGKTFTPFTEAAYAFFKAITKKPEEKKILAQQFLSEISEFKNDCVQRLWMQFELNDWLDCLIYDIKFSELAHKKSTMERVDLRQSLAADFLRSTEG